MSAIGVADAAAELGVSPRRVRQMLADGVLPGRRVGRAWLIESDHVRQVRHRRPGVGRPWSAASAWAVLRLAESEGLNEASPVDRSRAKKRLALGLGAIAQRLEARAELRRFYGHPGVLDRLADAGEVVVGGARAAVDHGADLVAGQDVEGYVRAGDLEEVERRFGLDGDSERPNVLLRVVDDELWPFDSMRVVGRAVAAVDLLGSPEQRSKRAGAELAKLCE